MSRRSTPSVALSGLHSLKTVAKEIKARHAQQQALRQAQEAAQRQAQLERNLFALSVGKVTPLRPRNVYQIPMQPAPPEPLQLQLDEQNVLREAMSDAFDVSTLLEVDAELSFRRPGIGPDVTRKLRAGHWSIQRQLDLHGLRTDEAREALGQFIRLSHRTGLRCVRIIHGKGLGSPGRVPVLKSKVLSWLVQKREVLAFVQARPADGGAGALLVLLQPGARLAHR
jgi:DNA-nicking Smr family endonuclease